MKLNVPMGRNWGLKVLALILAFVIYHALKTETAASGRSNDRQLIFQSPSR